MNAFELGYKAVMEKRAVSPKLLLNIAQKAFRNPALAKSVKADVASRLQKLINM